MPERSPYRFPHESRRLRSHRESCWKESRDRKSTRLNSSHGYISYAVFCLKKKKQHNRNTIKPFFFNCRLIHPLSAIVTSRIDLQSYTILSLSISFNYACFIHSILTSLTST